MRSDKGVAKEGLLHTGSLSVNYAILNMIGVTN
jgi:hypothetical protein